MFRVEVTPRQPVSDQRTIRAAQQLGFPAPETCYVSRLFFVQGNLSLEEVNILAAKLLSDPVTETFTVGVSDVPQGFHSVEITFHPGVTDPIASNLVRAAQGSAIDLQRAATGQRYLVSGDLDPKALKRLATEVFSNPIIQRYVIDEAISAPFVDVQAKDDTLEVIALRHADDDQLMAISKERRLSLDLNEMRAIREYFDKEDREPTDAELEMLAQTWSEHCVHKTFKAHITYTGPAHGAAADSPPVEQTVNGLLKTYIRAATEKVNKTWVRSAFVDNAGIVEFNELFDLAFKVETHNRPSALEPFGGANTGVGGVIRDVLGVSARPIANTDILCFGLPDTDKLPENVLHPRRVADGVIAGIEDYGNKMGIPTVNGAILYHKGYTANPLVFCGCLGILPRDAHRTQANAGDLIVVIGGRTGRDGLRGATFSSMEMDTTTSTVSSGAVQIGHPIMEKQVQEVVLRARDAGLYSAITDCGAGGLSSAVGEITSNIGANVQLEDVPLKYPGLRPWEIWLSEAQERMVLAVPPENWDALQAICDSQDVEAVAIGTFEPTGRLTLYYGKRLIADLTMDFLHDGIPQRHMTAVWTPPANGYADFRTSPMAANENYGDTLLQLLALPTIRSKEDVIRKYDHEVQGGTAVKPLVGVDAAGPSDAAVLVPQNTMMGAGGEGKIKAVALSNGICPEYGEIDPYAMAWAAVDEAMRNLVAVGADPDQVAILDNFCWGNTQLPDRLGSLVRCAQGCYDAAVAYGVPFISGKDSLNNEYLGEDGQRHAIPGTLLISAMGIVPDVSKTVTMDLKQEGNILVVIGETRDELGGSHYHMVSGIDGGIVPQPNPDAIRIMRAVHQAMQQGLVVSCHDVSEGGIAVALAEMCVAGRIGALVTPPQDLDENTFFFSESTGRFIVEVPQTMMKALLQFMSEVSVPCAAIGGVKGKSLGFPHPRTLIQHVKVEDLERAWRGHTGTTTFTPSNSTQSEAITAPAILKDKPRVLILHANGSNRDHDAFVACEQAGGKPEIVHVNQLFSGQKNVLDYHMVVVPGGFSYGDDLGAGVLWALDLRERLKGLNEFVAEGRPVLGICNGFQTLVKAGLLPGRRWTNSDQRTVTLTYNEGGHFECRWVYLKPNPASPCIFTQGLEELIHCPIAHGEGRLLTCDEPTLNRLVSDNLNALTYVDANGDEAGYPFNPNGSALNIAGLCNPTGNVFGLMPHPEDHIFGWQHPRRTRGESGMTGLRLFENGIRYSKR